MLELFEKLHGIIWALFVECNVPPHEILNEYVRTNLLLKQVGQILIDPILEKFVLLRDPFKVFHQLHYLTL